MWLVCLVTAIALQGCSAFKYQRDSTSSISVPSKNVLAVIGPHVDAMMEAYNDGDMRAARGNLETALRMLDMTDLTNNADKIDFIHTHYPAPYREISIRDIATQLLRIKYTAPANVDVAQSASVLADLEESRSLPRQATRSKPAFSRDLHGFIREEIYAVALEMGEDRDFKLPDDFVDEIENYIRQFQTVPRYNKFFNNALRRSRKYIPALKHHFEGNGFPSEIMYLAFIESAFNPIAVSRANAAGMFQFIKSTGKAYGLTINNGIDERFSPHAAAKASSDYLHDLVLELGSFTLALSSYNSGAGKTRRALRQLDDFRDRSFWALREKTSVLKSETREYVPQIFAAIVAAKPGNAARFGFKDIPFPNKSDYRMVIVPHSMNLNTFSREADIRLDRLRRLNPDLEPTATKTPSRVIDYPLFVPRGTEKRAANAIKKLSKKPVVARKNSSRSKKKTSTKIAATPVFRNSAGDVKYRVQSGNTVRQISEWFDVSSQQLQSWNPTLKKRGIRQGDVVIIKDPELRWQTLTHTIRKGESLSHLSDRYNIKIRKIKAWNGIAGNTIHAGKKVVLYRSSSVSRPVRPQAAKLAGVRLSSSRSSQTRTTNSGRVVTEQRISSGETFLYAVKDGNTLGEIAALFKVSQANLKRWNSLRSSSIRVGQKLKVISSRSMRFYKYKVSSGDTFNNIAARFEGNSKVIRIVNGKYTESLRNGEVINIFVMN